MAENGENKTSEQQGSSKDASGAGGVANKEVLEALGGIKEQLSAGQKSAEALSADDQALLKTLLDQGDGGKAPDPVDEVHLDDPNVRKAFSALEKKLELKRDELKNVLQGSIDANMEANIDLKVAEEIRQAHGKYGKALEENWEKVQAVVDKIPALQVGDALELVLAPERTKKLADIAAKEQAANEKKARAGIGAGVDISALTEGIDVETHAEAAEAILGKILAEGGQVS